MNKTPVTPANAGVQKTWNGLDSGLTVTPEMGYPGRHEASR